MPTGRREHVLTPFLIVVSPFCTGQQPQAQMKSISAHLHIVFWVICGRPTARQGSRVLRWPFSRCPARLHKSSGTPDMSVACCENARYLHFGRQQRRGAVLLEHLLRHHADPQMNDEKTATASYQLLLVSTALNERLLSGSRNQSQPADLRSCQLSRSCHTKAPVLSGRTLPTPFPRLHAFDTIEKT